MNCAEVRSRLGDLLYAELGEDDSACVTGHLERCGPCRAAWHELRSVSASLDRWTAPLPQGIAERVLAALAIRVADRARARRPLALHHVLGFLVAGAAAAAVAVLLIGAEAKATPLETGLAGAVWTALFSGIAFLTQHGTDRRLALAALIAGAVSVLFAPVLSMPAVIEACRRWLEAAQASVGLNVAIVLAGALYAGTPVLVSSALTRGTRAWPTAHEALRLAGAYGLLLAPSVYLQCHMLALSLVAPWIGGIVLGSFAGALTGVAIGSRLRPVST